MCYNIKDLSPKTKPMNFNKYTIKASEAVQTAQTLAQEYKHNAIDVLHLFFAMIEQKDGYIPTIIKK